MVKRREPSKIKDEPSKDQIEAFVSAADGKDIETKKRLNPNSKRDFKSISVPFNEYEYSKLEDIVKKTGRSKLNSIRWALLKLAEELD